MKSAILFRLGGLGDIIILTPVAKELARRGYVVDGCFGSPTCDIHKLLGNLGLFRNIYLHGKMFTGLDSFQNEEGDQMSVELLKQNYDLVCDYKFSIELNSHYKHLANGPGKEWYISQNSNFVNWVDMMFAWTGIDPTTIADEDKIPVYKVSQEEDDWAKRLLNNKGKVITIQTNASSLVRTWYHPDRLPKAIKAKFPGERFTFLVFDGGQWQMMYRDQILPVTFPANLDRMRASCALVANSELFIGADSGLSHIAEATDTKSVVIYTTVPAWTRLKYYRHAVAVEPLGDTFLGVQCRPCFTLDRYCPRIREKALGELSPRERRLKEAMEANQNPELVARELNTTPMAIVREGELLQHRLQALIEEQAPCTTTITTDRILEKVEKQLCA